MIDFYIAKGKENMNLSDIGEMLRNTYWAHSRTDEVIEKSLEKSECYGAFLKGNDKQIGFARIVTDDVTFFWVCDVVVDEKYRGNGIGKEIMNTIAKEEKYRNMKGLLATRDAHGLYEKIGFRLIEDSNHMTKQFGRELEPHTKGES